MDRRVNAFLAFVRIFLHHALYVRDVLIALLLLIILGGVTISQVEGHTLSEAIYFAFITGLSIGYGDIVPVTLWGRVVSVLIGLIGMIFTGMTIAVATRALADAVRQSQQRKQ